MKFRGFFFSSLLLSAWLPAADNAKPPAAGSDLIVHGASILAGDEKSSAHQAMRIKDGRIATLGTDAEIIESRTGQTRLIDLGGKTVLPGLIDSHVHPGAAMTEFDHPVPTMESIEDVLGYVRARAEALADGEWIEIRQVFITRLREQRYPTRAELDAAAPRNPVLFATGPDASLNSMALQLSGIDRDFRVGDGGPGYAEKDAPGGELTGILRGCTRYVKVAAKKDARKATEDDHRRRTHELFGDYNARGITGICDRNADPDAIARYEKMRDAGELSLRLFLSASVANLGPIETIQERIRSVAGHRLRKRSPADSETLRLIGIKTFLDGGMLTGSAYMREPWGVSKIYGITDPKYRGVLQIPRERLLPMARTAMENGLQFTAHSVGDGAVHLLLDVYEELNRRMPDRFRATRPCITHCNFMSAEAVAQLARLGAVADIQPIWLHLDARTLEAHFGNPRLRYFQPLRSLFAAGAVAGGGSDHMQKIGAERAVNPYDPFLGMWITTTRRARGLEVPLHPEESLTREQALRFYTLNNAHLLLAEKDIGSLEPGKFADFIVIDTDFSACPVDQIPKIKVLKTFVGGREVFARSPEESK